jgi:hypothetical protein
MQFTDFSLHKYFFDILLYAELTLPEDFVLENKKAEL